MISEVEMLLVFILLMEASGIFWYMFKKTYVFLGKKKDQD